MSMTNRNRAAVAAKLMNARANYAPIAMAILLAIPILLLGCPEETPAPDSTPEKYVCENGTPAPGDAPAADTTLCASCEAGFLLNDAFACVVEDSDGDNVADADDIDDDNDGLIEISSLLELHNMRHNLAGTSYKTGATGAGVTAGAPAAATADCKTATGGVYLCGYELAQNLDFDADGDDRTWDAATLALDEGDDVDGYFDVESGGWLPVGDADNPFVALFEGNGFTIANLATRRDQVGVGFFGEIGSGARVRNVGLTGVLAEYTGPDLGRNNISTYTGGLAGRNNSGTITASYTAGTIDGGENSIGNVGGLVGEQQGGDIIASFSSATVSNCAVGATCGGLLGSLDGRIVASYATGTVSTTNNSTSVSLGGLVGRTSDPSNIIIASYATGAVTGGFVNNRIGGLVGSNSASVIASYATGAVNGGDQGREEMGGLVGNLGAGSVIASYAIGNVDSRGGADRSGALVGHNEDNTFVHASYGFGAVSDEGDTAGLSPKPANVSAATALTEANAGVECDNLIYTTQTACEAVAKEPGTWISCRAGFTTGITYSAYTTEAECTATTKPESRWDGASSTCSNPIYTTRGACRITEIRPGTWSPACFAPDSSTRTDGVVYSRYSSETECEASTKAANVWNATSWSFALQSTLNAWVFAPNTRPKLRYADYDGAGTDYDCDMFIAMTCDTLLSGQGQ